jgi:hypothetical protein
MIMLKISGATIKKIFPHELGIYALIMVTAVNAKLSKF